MSEGFTCRGCGNFFFQAPKCVGCGAEKLYDSTVRLQGKEIEYQAARIAELEAALQSIVEYCDDPYLPYYKDILSKARAALEGGRS